MTDSRAGSVDLLRRTIRTVAILVGASVLFVGALSIIAVVVTNKAVGAKPAAAEITPPSGDAATAKKPLSI